MKSNKHTQKTDRYIHRNDRSIISSAAVLTFLFMLVLPCETVLADKIIDMERTGSVTIRYFDDVDARTPVNGAQFTFYKIDDIQDTTTYTDTTNQDGILKIKEMKLGRYRVVETSPAPGHKASASFLLTIPMTENNEWIYDINIEPKASPELETTTKSVYSTAGNTSTGSYQPIRTSVTSTSSTDLSNTLNRNTNAQKNTAVARSRPAETGDKSCSVFWIVTCLIAASILLKMFLSFERNLKI